MLKQGAVLPARSLRINWRNPLANGLTSVWTPGHLWSRIPRPAHGGTPVTGPFGLGAAFNGSSDSVALPLRALVHTSATSRYALIKVGTASGSKTISAGGNTGLGFRIAGTSLEVVQNGVGVLVSAASAVSTGEFCSVGFNYLTGTSSPGEIYKNGTRIQTGTASNTFTDNGTDFLGQSGSSSQYWDGHIYLHLSWSRVLTAAEMRALDDDPWQIFEPIRVPVKAASSGAYTLTADSAAWQFAAQNATLMVARKLTAANAPWEFAAQNAGLTVARKIAAGNAQWQFAVQDATLTYTPAGAYTLTAESAEWQFAVPDATLTYSGAAIRRRGAAKPLRKGYIIRGKKYLLTDDELAIMVALELETIKRSDIKVPTKGRIKPIPTATFEMVKAVAKKLDELASIGLDDDEDEEEELLLML